MALQRRAVSQSLSFWDSDSMVVADRSNREINLRMSVLQRVIMIVFMIRKTPGNVLRRSSRVI